MYWILILQQLIASTTHIVAKSLVLTLSPTLILLLRASIASLAYVSTLIFRKSKLFRIEKKDLIPFLILGFINIPMNQFLFFKSLEFTSPANVALAYALTPAFVIVIALIFLREKATKLKLLGILIAFIGTVFVLFEKGLDLKSDNFLGNGLALLASLSWAVYTVLGKKYVQKYGAIYASAVTMVFGLLLYLPIFGAFGHITEISKITSVDFLKIFYLGVITSGVGYALWYYSLKKLEASKVSVFNNLQPVLTTLMAVFFFDQIITIPFVLGGILTISGVILTQKG
ncbi:MAG: DMT family transporter [Candidatus Kapabacteria bacterium]|nr:DMT family transporter [Candidatus Kapabacteria bacterium]